MNNIMNVLVDNYIYVALGSLFLIIILIGIVVSSKKKHKPKNPDMVSMSDVQTGSINDVANSLNVQNNQDTQSGIKPLNVAEVYPSTNKPVEEPASKGMFGGVTPTNPEVAPQRPFSAMNGNVMPSAPEGSYTAASNKPIMDEPVKEPVFEPINEVQTSVPTPEPVAPVVEPASVVEPTPALTPIFNQPTAPVEPVYTASTTPVVESSAPVVSTPREEPEIMDIIDVPTNNINTTTPNVETNPLNGETPNFNQNDNQGIQ